MAEELALIFGPDTGPQVGQLLRQIEAVTGDVLEPVSQFDPSPALRATTILSFVQEGVCRMMDSFQGAVAAQGHAPRSEFQIPGCLRRRLAILDSLTLPAFLMSPGDLKFLWTNRACAGTLPEETETDEEGVQDKALTLLSVFQLDRADLQAKLGQWTLESAAPIAQMCSLRQEDQIIPGELHMGPVTGTVDGQEVLLVLAEWHSLDVGSLEFSRLCMPCFSVFGRCGADGVKLVSISPAASQLYRSWGTNLSDAPELFGSHFESEADAVEVLDVAANPDTPPGQLLLLRELQRGSTSLLLKVFKMSTTVADASVLVTVEDVSQQQELRYKLSELQVEMQHMRASADAHKSFSVRLTEEIRTPLTGITGALEYVGSISDDHHDDNLRNCIGIGLQCSVELHKLCNTVSELSAAEMRSERDGQHSSAQRTCTLGDIVLLIMDVCSIAKGSRARLAYDPERLEPLSWGTLYQTRLVYLRQVLSQLLVENVSAIGGADLCLSLRGQQRPAADGAAAAAAAAAAAPPELVLLLPRLTLSASSAASLLSVCSRVLANVGGRIVAKGQSARSGLASGAATPAVVPMELIIPLSPAAAPAGSGGDLPIVVLVASDSQALHALCTLVRQWTPSCFPAASLELARDVLAAAGEGVSLIIVDESATACRIPDEDSYDMLLGAPTPALEYAELGVELRRRCTYLRDEAHRAGSSPQVAVLASKPANAARKVSGLVEVCDADWALSKPVDHGMLQNLVNMDRGGLVPVVSTQSSLLARRAVSSTSPARTLSVSAKMGGGRSESMTDRPREPTTPRLTMLSPGTMARTLQQTVSPLASGRTIHATGGRAASPARARTLSEDVGGARTLSSGSRDGDEGGKAPPLPRLLLLCATVASPGTLEARQVLEPLASRLMVASTREDAHTALRVGRCDAVLCLPTADEAVAGLWDYGGNGGNESLARPPVILLDPAQPAESLPGMDAVAPCTAEGIEAALRRTGAVAPVPRRRPVLLLVSSDWPFGDAAGALVRAQEVPLIVVASLECARGLLAARSVAALIVDVDADAETARARLDWAEAATRSCVDLALTVVTGERTPDVVLQAASQLAGTGNVHARPASEAMFSRCVTIAKRAPSKRRTTSESRTRSSTSSSMSLATPAATRRVLVADDVKTNLVVSRLLLERLGCEVTTAANGEEAMQALRDRAESGSKFDMIFLDCFMPVMDGFEVAEAVRAAETDSRIPIVAMTADARPENLEHCRQAGMDTTMVKPISMHSLSQLLASFDAARQGAAAAAVRSPMPPSDEPPQHRVSARVKRIKPMSIVAASEGGAMESPSPPGSPSASGDQPLTLLVFARTQGSVSLARQTMVHRLLGQLKCEMSEWDTAETAITAWRSGRYDAVLVDVVGTGAEGREFVAQLRSEEAVGSRASTPVIGVVTVELAAEVCTDELGGSSADLVKSYYDAGMTDLVGPPVSLAAFRGCFRQHVFNQAGPPSLDLGPTASPLLVQESSSTHSTHSTHSTLSVASASASARRPRLPSV